MGNKDKSFLIINPFGIGDVLFTTPLIRNIKEKFPKSKIFYLCNRRTHPMLENHPLVEKAFIYERDEFEEVKTRSKFSWFKKIGNFISEIKKEDIDIVLDLSLNRQFSFFAWAAGIKERIGYNYKNRGNFLTKKIVLNGYEDKHIVEYYLELLKFIGLEPNYRKIELFLTDQQRAWAEHFIRSYGLSRDDLIVAVAPGGGASWGQLSFYKHWDKEKFAALADKITKEFKAKVFLVGDRKEREIIEDIEKLMKFRPLKAIALNLMDFLALLEKSAILVANDGGPLHMAVALGVKTVSIFGPVAELVYGPYPPDPKHHIVIKKDLNCRPCYRNFRLPECPYQQHCLKQISIEEVFKAVESLIMNNSVRS